MALPQNTDPSPSLSPDPTAAALAQILHAPKGHHHEAQMFDASCRQAVRHV